MFSCSPQVQMIYYGVFVTLLGIYTNIYIVTSMCKPIISFNIFIFSFLFAKYPKYCNWTGKINRFILKNESLNNNIVKLSHCTFYVHLILLLWITFYKFGAFKTPAATNYCNNCFCVRFLIVIICIRLPQQNNQKSIQKWN